jgi:hypothetical protein
VVPPFIGLVGDMLLAADVDADAVRAACRRVS